MVAESRQVRIPEIVRGGIDVGLVARGLGTAVDRVMLGRGDRTKVFRVVTLNAFDKGGAEPTSQERIFPVGFLAASPARIAKDVDVGRPDGESVVAIVIIVGDGVVVFGARFSRDDFADGVEKGRVPGSGLDLILRGRWGRRRGGRLRSCGKSEHEGDREEGWMQAHGNRSPKSLW